VTWTLDGPALDEVVQATSTATVRAAGIFRLFGIDPWQLGIGRSGPAPVAPGPCTTEPTLTYLESPSVLAPPSFTTSGTALRASCVPSRRLGVRWLVHAPNTVGERAEPHVERTLNVVYKDPSVVRLPDGTWLMIVARYRSASGRSPLPAREDRREPGRDAGPTGQKYPASVEGSPRASTESQGPAASGENQGPGANQGPSQGPAASGENQGPRPRPRGGPALQAPIAARPGESLGDIVAWHAPDPTFSAGVSGPYWLLDARTADPDGAGIAWLGVPGAVVRGRGAAATLELYYVVEPEGAARARMLPDDPAAPRTPTWDTDPVEPGIALTRFDWPSLRAALAAAATDERSWDTATAIPSTLAGRVRTWWAGAPGEVTPLADQFPSPEVHIADPAPLGCGAERVLFFAGIHGRPDRADPNSSGALGGWRGAPLPTDAAVCERRGTTCAALELRSGLDFLVGDADRLVTSRGASMYLDPDPVSLFGGVRVHLGNMGGDGGEAGGLVRVRGTIADACRSWRGAWSR
jgi:hypothetical protein